MGKQKGSSNNIKQSSKQDMEYRENMLTKLSDLEAKEDALYKQLHDQKLVNELRKDTKKNTDIFLESLDRYKKSAGMSLDTYGSDRLFALSFVKENKDMYEDFTFIFQDFLSHEYANLDQYGNEQYVTVDDGSSTGYDMLVNVGMNMMMNAVIDGSQYAKNLFLYLFKTYYKDEYKILKRFTKLTRSDIELISGFGELCDNSKIKNEDTFDPNDQDRIEEMQAFDLVMHKMARVIFFSKLNGIELTSDCSTLFAILDVTYEDYPRRIRLRNMLFEKSGIIYPDCVMEANIHYPDNKMSGEEEYTRKIVAACIKWLGFNPDQFSGKEKDDNYPGIEYIDRATALLILKIAFPEKIYSGEVFSEQQVAFAYQMLMQIRTTISLGAKAPYKIISSLFPQYVNGDKLSDKARPKLFVKEKIVVSDVSKKANDEKVPVNVSEKTDVIESLLEQIKELRLKVHSLENENQALREGYENIRLIKDENKNYFEKMNALNMETSALRNYVYGLTEDDLEETKVDIEEMKNDVRKKKVVIIGGHPHWVQKLRLEFPEWKYIGATVSGALDAGIVEGVDFVYFFTDTLSHSTYYKYLSTLRDRNLKFGYIHGVNIEKNIKQFYTDIIKK